MHPRDELGAPDAADLAAWEARASDREAEQERIEREPREEYEAHVAELCDRIEDDEDAADFFERTAGKYGDRREDLAAARWYRRQARDTHHVLRELCGDVPVRVMPYRQVEPRRRTCDGRAHRPRLRNRRTARAHAPPAGDSDDPEPGEARLEEPQAGAR